MMLEGCRRLRELGAREALVLSWHENEALYRLYASSGFRTRRRDDRYSKTLDTL
jgi:ribosomal protein S18 acetylase RimI-like enzyme